MPKTLERCWKDHGPEKPHMLRLLLSQSEVHTGELGEDSSVDSSRQPTGPALRLINLTFVGECAALTSPEDGGYPTRHLGVTEKP